jgi:hypothetical protein
MGVNSDYLMPVTRIDFNHYRSNSFSLYCQNLDISRLLFSLYYYDYYYYLIELQMGFYQAAVVQNKTNELHGLSPRANYIDRATAACQRSDCQLLRIEGATWSA